MTARDHVTAHIAEQALRFPDLDLTPVEPSALSARDAALAFAIERAVLRRWLTLQHILQRQLSRPWAELEPKMQAVLLTGAAQLLLLEKLPDHAVIHEAVEWAKRHVRPKAGGMVNAVLRKVASLRKDLIARQPNHGDAEWGVDELPLSDGRIWRLREPIFDHAPLMRLAQQTSHPHELLQHWVELFGAAKAKELAAHDLIIPPTIVHDLLGHDLPANQFAAHAENGFHVIEATRTDLAAWLSEHPSVIVQDPTSAMVVERTRSLSPPPRLIIDACAGLGTKTRQLAAIHPSATIIATDVAQWRLKVLRSLFAAHSNVRVIQHGSLGDFAGRADLVLLDVPCGNSGVLARRVEAKYRFSDTTTRELVDLQRQIVRDAIPLLKDDGRILYSTCSIDPAENQQQARWLCESDGFAIELEHARFPNGIPGDAATAYGDGGYFALLRRGRM